MLPAVCVSGESWKEVRRLLEVEYEDLVIVTIAVHGQTDLAFSADTGMAEALVVATKCRAGREGSGKHCSSTSITGHAVLQKPLK